MFWKLHNSVLGFEEIASEGGFENGRFGTEQILIHQKGSDDVLVKVDCLATSFWFASNDRHGNNFGPVTVTTS